MSTEHQQYSTENQRDTIREYANGRGMVIVRTFEDAGKSGLRIDGRDALKRLIQEVETGQADFEVILVFDVSRWGRFQDADESAYYEYICRRAGIQVHYCAEQFENDGSPVSTIVKGVKRAMAGEYSRELSAKVFIGQCRLIELGYRQGGAPGFGLRRMLLNVDVGAIRQRRDLLDGICKEAAEILKNKVLAPNLFGVLKKMKPIRQLEVTELMGAVSNFSVPYAKALLAATRSEMLVDPEKHKLVAGLSPDQVAKMEREMEVLQRDLRVIEDSNGNQVLNLVLARGYLAKLLANTRVVRYLVQNHADIFRELKTIAESATLDA